jgi:hypothetical protein
MRISPEKNSPTPSSVPAADLPATADAARSPDSAAPDTDTDTGAEPPTRRREIGGPSGPEPTRFGDWERKGRCIDF